ncbi:Mad3/BUB1 homology region 1-domain-containing protein [Halteromyces radiatus]|uniref:Mad3/BUB1 homology region 1-domain-containing protein n=1 Tax=Halteromyces radiatus TaxID=101107 RepID=UPI00221E5E49|nr:Mad3/BUB1 homology region 1-domain-containing protein [Halteromyces radiatus]KAI8099628.1 Mad3/BUB1 homology region 1-domain-containing protein [Halteromyces radiatus]
MASNLSSIFDETERQRLIDSIPKFEDVENNLENIQPLKGGRRARALVASSLATDDERQRMIQQERDCFASKLEKLDDMDDPLDVYVRHLQWTIQMFPEGQNHESQLVDLLEQVTNKFQDDPRYILDPRYLNCWMEYAKWTDDPKDVFLFLKKKGIGQNLALFYEQYAFLYEEQKRYKEASDILNYGIERRAQPLGRLKRTKEQFIHRLQHRKQHEESINTSNPTRDQMQSLLRTGQRTMLGHKLDTRHPQSVSRNVYNNMQNNSTFIRDNSNTSSSSSASRSFGNSITTSTPSNSFKFQVFTDDGEGPQSTSPSPPFSSPSIDTSPSSTPNMSISAFSRKRQENMVPVETFAGATLPQKQTLTRPSIPKFNVFRDDAGQSEEITMDASDYDQTDERHRHVDMNDDLIRNGSSKHTYSDSRHHSHHHSRYNRQQLADDETIGTSSLLMILQDRYHKLGDHYITSTDTSKKPMTIAAKVEYESSNGRTLPVSFDEVRAYQQVNRRGQPQIINIGAFQKTSSQTEATIPCSVQREPTMDYTTETLAAQQSINAMFNKRNDDLDSEDDDEQVWKRPKREYADENI